MKLFAKKKIEFVVEAACAPMIIEMLDDVGATGYTMVPKVSGKGVRGVRNDAHFSGVFSNVLIIVIAAEDIAMRAVEASQNVLEHYAGITTVSDVEVVRDEHF